jgi:hypothetical protein
MAYSRSAPSTSAMPAIVPPFQTPHSITQPCARTVEDSRRLAMYSFRPSIVRSRYFEYTRSNWSVCSLGSRRSSSPNNLKAADAGRRTADLAIVWIRLGNDCTVLSYIRIANVKLTVVVNPHLGNPQNRPTQAIPKMASNLRHSCDKSS